MHLAELFFLRVDSVTTQWVLSKCEFGVFGCTEVAATFVSCFAVLDTGGVGVVDSIYRRWCKHYFHWYGRISTIDFFCFPSRQRFSCGNQLCRVFAPRYGRPNHRHYRCENGAKRHFEPSRLDAQTLGHKRLPKRKKVALDGRDQVVHHGCGWIWCENCEDVSCSAPYNSV